jgi:hypothetical protein
MNLGSVEVNSRDFFFQGLASVPVLGRLLTLEATIAWPMNLQLDWFGANIIGRTFLSAAR